MALTKYDSDVSLDPQLSVIVIDDDDSKYDDIVL